MISHFILLLATIATAAAQSPPSPEEQRAVIEATRVAALSFTDKLPDFICTQVTRRWMSQKQAPSSIVIAGPRGRMGARTTQLSDSEAWKLYDTLTIQLTYFGQKEQYKLLLVNGKQTKQSYESLSGATEHGDFGSLLGILFEASSQAQFTWDHWAVLNNQTVMVFNFSVDAPHSQWHIGYENQEVVAAFRGSAFIEPTQHQVLKLKINAVDIPKEFPIQKSAVELDYRVQPVGDHEFLLPLKAVNWTDAKNISTRNEAEFRLYRKFSTDSKIDFDTPAPLPANQTKETIPNNQP